MNRQERQILRQFSQNSFQLADNFMSATKEVTIFDTTLRDGEQSPGASMNLQEKLEIAQALIDLGVNVIEAGFPIASPGDFEAVQQINRLLQSL